MIGLNNSAKLLKQLANHKPFPIGMKRGIYFNRIKSEKSKIWDFKVTIVRYSPAFHFNQPARTTDRCMHYHRRNMGKSTGIKKEGGPISLGPPSLLREYIISCLLLSL